MSFSVKPITGSAFCYYCSDDPVSAVYWASFVLVAHTSDDSISANLRPFCRTHALQLAAELAAVADQCLKAGESDMPDGFFGAV